MNIYLKKISPDRNLLGPTGTYKTVPKKIKEITKEHKMELNLKEENLLKRFTSHGVPCEIYIDDAKYTEAESKNLRAQFILTLAGVDYKCA